MKELILLQGSRCLQHLDFGNILRTVSLSNESERYTLCLTGRLSAEEMPLLGPHPAMFDRGRYVFAQVYPFLAHFRATAVGIQAVKTTSALIAMSSSCIKTFLVKHHNLAGGGKELVCLTRLAWNSSRYDAYHRKQWYEAPTKYFSNKSLTL